MAVPGRIPIRYQPEYRSWCIGHYDDGQFLGFVVVGNAYDYLARAGPGHGPDFLDPQVDDLLPQRVLHDRDFVNHQRHYSVLHLFRLHMLPHFGPMPLARIGSATCAPGWPA
jgi:hypothetical protein